jgi:hypothetical protein
MKDIAPETAPDENMMRAIHIRAPTLSRMTFEGAFEQKIREEEDARAEAKRRLGEVEVGMHCQLGEADVHPVEIGDERSEDQEGDESPRHPPDQL